MKNKKNVAFQEVRYPISQKEVKKIPRRMKKGSQDMCYKPGWESNKSKLSRSRGFRREFHKKMKLLNYMIYQSILKGVQIFIKRFKGKLMLNTSEH